ncbi:MAG: hypothetical protein WKF81_10990 [Thermomicrobiales bacterium]
MAKLHQHRSDGTYYTKMFEGAIVTRQIHPDGVLWLKSSGCKLDGEISSAQVSALKSRKWLYTKEEMYKLSSINWSPDWNSLGEPPKNTHLDWLSKHQPQKVSILRQTLEERATKSEQLKLERKLEAEKRREVEAVLELERQAIRLASRGQKRSKHRQAIKKEQPKSSKASGRPPSPHLKTVSHTQKTRKANERSHSPTPKTSINANKVNVPSRQASRPQLLDSDTSTRTSSLDKMTGASSGTSHSNNAKVMVLAELMRREIEATLAEAIAKKAEFQQQQVVEDLAKARVAAEIDSRRKQAIDELREYRRVELKRRLRERDLTKTAEKIPQKVTEPSDRG